MRALLFDRNTGGHHLEYASRLGAELTSLGSDVTVEFVTPLEDDQLDGWFDTVETTQLDRATSNDSLAAAGEELRAVADYADRTNADVVHLLHLDDVLLPASRVFGDGTAEVPVVGSLNGEFFQHPRAMERLCGLFQREPVRTLVGVLSRTPLGAFDPLPGPFVQSLGMIYALRRDAIDQFFVHADSAGEFLERLEPAVDYSVIPDPLDVWFEDGPSKTEARRELGLPESTPVLLFFGELRREKGIDTLLDALRIYDGPTFTMVIAGTPTDVEASEVETAANEASVDVRTELEFIPESAVRTYFHATDGVVVPYRKSFGEHRTSGVFQKAAGACRPVVAPDFGTFGRRVRDHDLGVAFEPESPRSLADAMSRVVRGDTPFDPERVRQYAYDHTYEALAETTYRGYEAALKSDSPTDAPD